MSVSGEKKFVLKHVFKDPRKAGEYALGDIKEFFGIPWRLYVYGRTQLKLESFNFQDLSSWSLEVDIELSLGNKKVVEVNGKTFKFSTTNLKELVFNMKNDLDTYLIDGNLIVELVVKINKSTGICFREHLDFGENKKEYSDVVLMAGDLKFYVNKMYLAYHSSYFKSLFLGNFSESEKSIIELKDIDPDDLQNFLDVLYGEPALSEYNLLENLKLADMYDAKTVTRRCEDFLIKNSKKSLKEKFNLAVQYKMDELMKKCIADITTREEIRLVIPEDPNTIDGSIWKEIVEKSLSIQ
ncbi:unnamed protein product [Caenorhabditis nigoni]